MTGQPEHKIGVEEFMSIAERFGFSAEAQQRIRAAISETDLGKGPNLAKYATAQPPQTKGAAIEALAREKFGVKSVGRQLDSGTDCAMIAAVLAPARGDCRCLATARPWSRQRRTSASR